ncbi:MAG: AsmA family protein [Alphaproteobacteria bacterium]|nr:AsmA family protein [Alphaproteobacteria bacterium]
MLKKIVIGILCFLILAVTGVGIYIYTLNWNNHKDVVAKRFSQITGLKAVIDGNLKVDLLPKPKFTANSVRFIDRNPRLPLIEINEISADVELMPLLENKFILNSMTLKGATIHLNIAENGDFNWKGVSKKGKTSSGNVEVSFNDVKMLDSTISYTNKLTNDEFEIHGVSGTTRAQSIEGPYRLNGRFRHNDQDVLFDGDVVNGDTTSVRLNINNTQTASEIKIDGTLGKTAKGNIVFNSKNLHDTTTLAFGKDFLSDVYNYPLSVSFHYDHNDQTTNFDNFTVKYGNNTAGSGNATIKKDDGYNIDADFDMLQFDLGLLENIANSIISTQKHAKIVTTAENNTELNENEATKTEEKSKNKIKYNANINVKSNHAVYHGADAQKLNFGISINNDNIQVNRFAVTMPGETVIKSVGKINLHPKFEYIFNQTIDAQDIKSFVYLIGTDLTKYAPLENRKDIFKRAQADFNISGDLDAMKVSIAKAIVDSTMLSGNIGVIFNKDKNVLLIQADASKILFDKYLQLKTSKSKSMSLKDKFVYQMNLAPWKGNFETDATIRIDNAVYNNVPIEGLNVNFIANEKKLDIAKFSVSNMAQAQLNLKASIDNVYTDPYFNELTYDVQTNNFPLFSSSIGVNTGKKPLFKRKLFASQGALSGKFSEFSLSSVQKFGDTEFSYSGTVTCPKDKKAVVNGNIELKTNNFKNFAKDLGFNYNPDIPVTAFALSGDILGQSDLFEINKINAYLGANHIEGNIKLDNTLSKPKLLANLNFDIFDVNRMFNLERTEAKDVNLVTTNFIEKPNFSDVKIDYSLLNKLDFDITSKVNQLIWNNSYYSNFEGKAVLNDKILNVNKMSAEKGDSLYKFDFILNTKSLANIKGNYDIVSVETPVIGGKVYKLSKALLDANGSFNSIASSKKDFFENLNSKGRLTLSDVTVDGWDFDIIKFEFEQRKSVDGFEDTILNSLKTGRTTFSSIKSKYDIVRGVVVIDDATWLSPVADINMTFNLNLSDWKFNSEFNVFYHNASFSDVLEYSLDGNLANPTLKLEIDNVVNRIGKIEQVIIKEKEDIQKKKIEQLQNKINSLKDDLTDAFNNIDRISLDIARFKPITQNANVVKVYETTIEELKDINANLKNLKELLDKSNDEKTLMNIEADLAKETSRIKIIPKTLEENYVVDSKYVFDDNFSKLTWLFNLAQNNSSYFNSLTDVYMTQVDILKSTDEPLSEDKVSELQKSIETINADLAKIDEFYTINRDNYLKIIDTNSVNEMTKNNASAYQALQTMLDDVKKLNANIVKSIDLFREALGIKARDYDLYIVFPPETIDSIDTSLPTDKNYHIESIDELTKKKDRLNISLNSVTSGIASLYKKFKQQKKAKDIANIGFDGLSGIVDKTTEAKEPILSTPIETTIAQSVDIEENKENIASKEVAEINPSEIKVALADMPVDTSSLDKQEVNVNKSTIDSNKEIDTNNENMSFTSSILSKTKEALASLMSNITKKEKEITAIPQKKLEDINKEVIVATSEIQINDDNLQTLSQEDTTLTNNHKVNPVIAMNIGQNENANEIDIELANVHERKGGFVAKETIKEPETPLKNDNIIVAEEEKVDAKEEFIKLFANTNDNFVKMVNIETPQIIVSHKNEVDHANNNKYIFKTSASNNIFSGNIGKSSLKEKNQIPSDEINNKYVFNKADVKSSNFSGKVGKKIALSVN